MQISEFNVINTFRNFNKEIYTIMIKIAAKKLHAFKFKNLKFFGYKYFYNRNLIAVLLLCISCYEILHFIVCIEKDYFHRHISLLLIRKSIQIQKKIKINTVKRSQKDRENYYQEKIIA